MNDLIKHFYQQSAAQENEYNIFSVLHNESDETRLHSRFLAFLLDPKGSHGYGETFLNAFLQNILKIEFDSSTYKVHREYQYIDILIENGHEAIIIENKIFAGDSNDKGVQDELDNLDNDSKVIYRGQLERYYNVISNGRNRKSNDINLGKRKVVKLVYLTLIGREPSKESVGKLAFPIERISYINDIAKWLDWCALETKNDSQLNLKLDIIQYKALITKLTSDVNVAKNNQLMISDYIEQKSDIRDLIHFFTDRNFNTIFNHVKWHTISDFFERLNTKLNDLNCCDVMFSPAVEDITKVAHSSGRSRQKLILRFYIQGMQVQIVNDSNGFTFGNLTSGHWDYFSENIKRIKFNDFAIESTFNMINVNFREEVIGHILNEVLCKLEKPLPHRF